MNSSYMSGIDTQLICSADIPSRPIGDDVTRASSAIMGGKRRHPIGAMKRAVRACVRAHSNCCTNEMPRFDSQNGTFCACAVVCERSVG